VRGAAVLLLALLSGCTHLVWYGRSPDRRHTVAVIERGERQFVRHDFRDGAPFKGIGVDALRLDEKRLAYPAQLDDGAWVVVIDGVASEKFDAIGAVVLDGGRITFVAERAGKWFVAREGLPTSGPWDEVLDGSVRADAFAARRDNKAWVVRGAEPFGPFDAVGQLTATRFVARTTEGVFVYSSASERLGPFDDVVELTERSFAAHFGKSWKVFDLKSGTFGPPFERVGGFAVFDDTSFYAGRRDGQEFVVAGATEWGPFRVLKRQLLRSSAGLVFAGKRERGWFVQRGAAESGPWEDVSALTAFDGHDAFIGERDGRSVVVLDGVEQKSWELATGLVLARGGRVLHVARSGNQNLVVDGETTTPFDLIVADTLVATDDGRHYGCVTGEAKTKRLFITFDDGARVPVDLEELTAAMTRVPPAGLLSAPESVLLRDWVRAELSIHFGVK
jgi:hypothetical protein